jgi:voltage-gated potassium channel
MTTTDNKAAGMLRHFTWKPVRFVQLFFFIILVILMYPVLNRSPLLSALLAIFLLNILIVTLSFSGFDMRYRWHLTALWLLGILLDGAGGFLPAPQVFLALSDLVRAVLIVICVVMIFRYVLSSHQVTVDTVFGAFVAYFLIAFAFSALFQAIAAIQPESFSLTATSTGSAKASIDMQLSYFSFVTIATLGYGDIVPKLPLAQMLAILEAVVGQFYMAVVIAWLVSELALTRRESRSSGRERDG